MKHKNDGCKSKKIPEYRNGDRSQCQICSNAGYVAVNWFQIRDMLLKQSGGNATTFVADHNDSSTEVEHGWILESGASHH